jgi:hypothetical protein
VSAQPQISLLLPQEVKNKPEMAKAIIVKIIERMVFSF